MLFAATSASEAPHSVTQERDMAYSWLKSNPFMSVWLSAANRIAGSLRGHATAHAKRRMSAAVTAGSKGHPKLWAEAVAAACGKAKPKRKR